MGNSKERASRQYSAICRTMYEMNESDRSLEHFELANQYLDDEDKMDREEAMARRNYLEENEAIAFRVGRGWVPGIKFTLIWTRRDRHHRTAKGLPSKRFRRREIQKEIDRIEKELKQIRKEK